MTARALVKHTRVGTLAADFLGRTVGITVDAVDWIGVLVDVRHEAGPPATTRLTIVPRTDAGLSIGAWTQTFRGLRSAHVVNVEVPATPYRRQR